MSTTPNAPRPRPAAAKPAAPAARPAAAAPAAPPAASQQATPQPQAAAQQPQQGGGAEIPPDETSSDTKFALAYGVPSGTVSFVIHLVLLLILAFIASDIRQEVTQAVVVSEMPGPEEEIEEIEDQQIEPINVNPDAVQTDAIADAVPDAMPSDVTEPSPADDLDSAAVAVELNPLGDTTAPKNDMLREIGAFTGTGLQGRGEKARAANVQKYGGTKGSEAAVALALKWLAAHQLPDGGWNFDHRGGACNGRCRNHGTLANNGRNGATGMALLPFLGAGQTHMEGQYKETVKRGLQFLLRSMKVQQQPMPRGELSDGGTMYSHGICAIVLCEAYAMTHDKALMQPAQASLNHIVYAQDPVGGGWRYQPRTPGDTSAVGWQLMALKSGHMAYLNVPPQTVKLASQFLDSVQADSGAQYGYTSPATGRDGTTAVGLLCRMYLGWKHDTPGIIGGAQYLSKKGPSKTNMYYNYYATQVLRHYEGEEWKKWNEVMREQMVNTQAKSGHEEGSWHMGSDHSSDKGGRLYSTSMATMILEVYYRHMPIYQKAASKDDFQL